jgi:hypothetical protein
MFNQKLIFLIINIILINKIGISLSIENLFGDECICDGRCKECIIPHTAKKCELCSGYYGLDFKNLGIDNYNSELNPQLPHRTCVCPANYLQINSGKNVSNASSEVVFVKVECRFHFHLIDDRLCIGINPQLIFLGINLTEYWLIIGSIFSIVLILFCAIISLHKNNCCFNSEPLLQIYGQNFPLSTITQSRVESSISNDYTNDNILSEIRSNSSLPPTYDEVINIGCNNNQHLSKHLINANIIESSDHLPTYEDAVRTGLK